MKKAVSERDAHPFILDRETFGVRLRTARKKLGWTLVQLAERSGVSIPTISRAERGQLALGYQNFSALGHAMGMDMNAMFAEPGIKPGRLAGPVLTRAGEGVVYRGLSFNYEFLGTTAAGKQMSPVVGTVHARRIHGSDDYARHAGEEFVYVLSGEVEVHFEDGQLVRLARGDSLYFDSRIGHTYISVSRQLGRILGCTTSEGSHMQAARIGAAVRALAAGDAPRPSPRRGIRAARG